MAIVFLVVVVCASVYVIFTNSFALRMVGYASLALICLPLVLGRFLKAKSTESSPRDRRMEAFCNVLIVVSWASSFYLSFVRHGAEVTLLGIAGIIAALLYFVLIYKAVKYLLHGGKSEQA